MSPQQRGYYINLLSHAWLAEKPGTLPNDPNILWRLAGAESPSTFESDGTDVLAQFKIARGGNILFNERMCAERQAQKRRAFDRAKAGEKGAKSRWKTERGSQNLQANNGRIEGTRVQETAQKLHTSSGNEINEVDGKAIVLPMAKNGSASAFASASATAIAKSSPLFVNSQDASTKLSLTDENALRERFRESFQVFYQAYPKKIGEPRAWQQWLMLKDTDLRVEIFTGLETWKKSAQWQSPQYIPNPARFLEERRWMDSPEKGNENGRPEKHRNSARALPAEPGKDYNRRQITLRNDRMQ